LFGRSPYENVIVNGIVLAEDGQKMSKRLRNYPDPMEVVDKYGMDALRYYLLASPVVKAQDLCFSEKGVDEVLKKVFNRLDNVLQFYLLYSSSLLTTHSSLPTSTNVLDRWILARLTETTDNMTEAFEGYELDKVVRPIGDFVEDLSTWYLRRSRDRFKGANEVDKQSALAATRFVLAQFAKLLAPVAPFFAEYLYDNVKGLNDFQSV
ncbi:MAG: class I tRNA ligase family protein, partial [Candidatus Paceibacterota bacterium]